MASPSNQLNDLFGPSLSVINVGLEILAESVRQQGSPVVDVDWRPPPGDVPWLTQTSDGTSIDAANREVVTRIMNGRPTLVGLDLARNVVPGMIDRMILHAGPPITWERMCGPTRGAVMGALVYEGLATTPGEAEKLAASGEISFAPCHHHHAVGPMAGIISPSMPVWIIENAEYGNKAFCTLNEGLGRVLRYGAYGEDVYERLHWMADVLFPTLTAALEAGGPIDLRSIIAQALHMGDECHNRNRAGTSLLLRALAPGLARTCPDSETLAKVIEFIDGNDHFFLNLSMPAAKAMLEAAEGVPGSTIVTVMARNGTDFGIRLAGDPEKWHVAPAGRVEGLYLPGFSEGDANPDIGDSTITETAGFGAFAMAAAPAIASFVGGTAEDALGSTLEAYEICAAEHSHFTIPVLDFRGSPTGIDVRLVARTSILPKLNTGIAHKDPGIGMVGAGVLHAPGACFEGAFAAVRSW
jgi:hypothetical protein